MYRIVFLFLFFIISFPLKATNCEVENETVVSKGTCIGEIKYSTGETIKSKFVDGIADGYADVTYSDNSKYNGSEETDVLLRNRDLVGSLYSVLSWVKKL